MDFVTKIKNYKDASYSAVWVLTHEERRARLDIISLMKQDKHLRIHEWDAQTGLQEIVEEGKPKEEHPEETQVPADLLRYIQSYRATGCVFILKDFHKHFDKPIITRLLRNSWNALKSRGNIIIFIGHTFSIPPEIEKEIQLVDYALPDEAGINERLDFILKSVNKAKDEAKKPKINITDAIREAAVEAAKGMTFVEVENAFSMAYVENMAFDNKFVSSVFAEKIAQLKKSDLLTYVESNIGFAQVGGYNGLKKWIGSRKKAFSKAARAYKLPLPKGILLASVPGTGKTLLAKAIAKEFDCPLFYLDIGKVFGSLVGDSERNMRELIKTIESIGKCVILLDEVEKSLSTDATSGRGDTGVSSRIFGSFLTWLNDRSNPAFIVATSNNHTILPPALVRKGRFDQLFWMDLPSADDRKEIWDVVVNKYGRSPADFSIKKFVKSSDTFTGAEIEEVFKDSMFNAFSEDKEVNDAHIEAALGSFIPFAASHADDLDLMRKRAKGKLVMVTTEGQAESFSETMRKLKISLD